MYSKGSVPFSARSAAITLSIALLVASPAAAQSSPATTQTVPGITVSVGAGVNVPYCCPEAKTRSLSGSVQVPLGSRVFAEGQWLMPSDAHTTTTFRDGRLDFPYNAWAVLDRTKTVQGISGGMFYRLGTGRFRPYVGGGFTYTRVREDWDWQRFCEPRVPNGCSGVNVAPSEETHREQSIRAHFTPGIELALARSIVAFGAVRIDDGVTPYGGVRIALTRREATPSVGPEVRVSLTKGGIQSGRLVRLSPSEVVLQRAGSQVALPIADVRKVTKVSHRMRNSILTGAILGYVVGYLSSCGGGDEGDCWPEVGLLVAGMGAGAGAAAGVALNRAQASQDILYAGPGGSVSSNFRVMPLVSPDRAGVGMMLRW